MTPPRENCIISNQTLIDSGSANHIMVTSAVSISIPLVNNILETLPLCVTHPKGTGKQTSGRTVINKESRAPVHVFLWMLPNFMGLHFNIYELSSQARSKQQQMLVFSICGYSFSLHHAYWICFQAHLFLVIPVCALMTWTCVVSIAIWVSAEEQVPSWLLSWLNFALWYFWRLRLKMILFKHLGFCFLSEDVLNLCPYSFQKWLCLNCLCQWISVKMLTFTTIKFSCLCLWWTKFFVQEFFVLLLSISETEISNFYIILILLMIHIFKKISR